MAEQTPHASVLRVKNALIAQGLEPEIRELNDSARSAREAADALSVEVGQIASSIVFTLTRVDRVEPLLVITSGRHRVDIDLVAEHISHGTIGRADADFVRTWSGFAIGGVSPIGWVHSGENHQPLTFVDVALGEHKITWAAAGHTHVVYRTSFTELVQVTGGKPITVSND